MYMIIYILYILIIKNVFKSFPIAYNSISFDDRTFNMVDFSDVVVIYANFLIYI